MWIADAKGKRATMDQLKVSSCNQSTILCNYVCIIRVVNLSGPAPEPPVIRPDLFTGCTGQLDAYTVCDMNCHAISINPFTAKDVVLLVLH